MEEGGRNVSDLTFEQAMERLEEVVARLEHGDIPLEEAIKLYGEGTKLAGMCRKKLDWAEQQVEILVEENGEWTKRPFQPIREENT
ncbi:exodeoxyribonuclease VII small subunit [Shimazuella sp. AN120528]|nr:exodeoxyribonuclease VII small subunit [Shimazuella soli]MCH5584202.1 exodeoxyribonuclease VII small subunit [Shimazuella soli]